MYGQRYELVRVLIFHVSTLLFKSNSYGGFATFSRCAISLESSKSFCRSSFSKYDENTIDFYIMNNHFFSESISHPKNIDSILYREKNGVKLKTD